MIPRRRGIFAADVVVGLAVIGLVAGMLAVAINREQKTLDKFADTRAAARLAQNALDQLQNPLRASRLQQPADPRIKTYSLQLPAPEGKSWIQIQATVRGETESLIGLVAKENSP